VKTASNGGTSRSCLLSNDGKLLTITLETTDPQGFGSGPSASRVTLAAIGTRTQMDAS